ncbi:L,D-transpeptidase family protein [Aurantimonas sp. MSK8Z-1]|uniref:L,D-transpeptidase family protein n=1 Tax=Mangrovibrevibacter kandeliae TaxID=2968473 RepID=UPI00211991ED|nr:L,D-transpeptidase family protein [Aurantimonas sp. MSK8Z-1]MCW4115385.1 L,D-transpeptidase family protein [Aurantimonas sp. MSK8Z-1]
MHKKRTHPVLLLRPASSCRRRGVLQAGILRLPCALGRGGTSIFKREGDGATPVAKMQLMQMFRRDRRLAQVRSALPGRDIRQDDGWCDAPQHPAYNRPVRLPFAASAEAMRRHDHLYDLVIVLDWNVRQRMRGRGSAIFLHCAKPDYEPTAGCIAIAPRDFIRLQAYLRPGVTLEVRR